MSVTTDSSFFNVEEKTIRNTEIQSGMGNELVIKRSDITSKTDEPIRREKFDSFKRPLSCFRCGKSFIQASNLAAQSVTTKVQD